MSHLAAFRPGPLPPVWREIPAPEHVQQAWEFAGLKVLVSLDVEEDTGVRWYHVSVSYAGGPCSFNEARRVRRLFFKSGADVEVWSPRANNLQAWHLWERVKEDA